MKAATFAVIYERREQRKSHSSSSGTSPHESFGYNLAQNPRILQTHGSWSLLGQGDRLGLEAKGKMLLGSDL